jgi:phage shock protein C
MMTKKLYKSRTNKMFSGVCGGIAEYLRIDPTIVRLVWCLVGWWGGGIVAYIVCACIIPEQPSSDETYYTSAPPDDRSN